MYSMNSSDGGSQEWENFSLRYQLISLCMWKAIVSGTAGTARPDCRRPQAIDLCIPEETISNQGGIQAIVFQGETVFC